MTDQILSAPSEFWASSTRSRATSSSVTLPAGTRAFTHDARGKLAVETLPGGGTVTLVRHKR